MKSNATTISDRDRGLVILAVLAADARPHDLAGGAPVQGHHETPAADRDPGQDRRDIPLADPGLPVCGYRHATAVRDRRGNPGLAADDFPNVADRDTKDDRGNSYSSTHQSRIQQ